MKTKIASSNLQSKLAKIASWHFWLVALFMGQIILYDASQLITPQVVLQRWLAAAGLLVVAASVWYFAKNKPLSEKNISWLAFALIWANILFASFNVYAQRGMASRAVILFVIPILIAALLKRASTIFATAIFCIAAYTTTAIAYFVINFNEGYRVELYGEIGFYSILLLIISGFVWTIVKGKD